MDRDRLTPSEIVLWSALGAAAGLVAGVAVSEWVGDVNQPRLRRAADRLQAPKSTRLGAVAGARAALAALRAQPLLHELELEAIPVAQGVVELRGWVDNRAARSMAARTVSALPGIDHVINSILVHGEDDRPAPAHETAEAADAAEPSTDHSV